MENITNKISFLDKIKNKIEKTITQYYVEPNQINELEIHKLYNNLQNNEIEESSDDDDDDDEYYHNDINHNIHHYLYKDNNVNEDKPSDTAIEFYNKFMNNDINNDMINRYSDKKYLKLYKNYKMNFNL